MKIGEDRKNLVKNWTAPKILTELRSLLALLQFFRLFIRNFSHIAAPLTNLTLKGHRLQNCSMECTAAFEKLKELLCTAPIIRTPDWDKSFRCHVDASAWVVGGTLAQIDASVQEFPKSYFSKRFPPAEDNYSANYHELLGLICFLLRFRCYLEGSEAEVVTDNQVLRYFFSKLTLSRREARWLEFLSGFGITK